MSTSRQQTAFPDYNWLTLGCSTSLPSSPPVQAVGLNLPKTQYTEVHKILYKSPLAILFLVVDSLALQLGSNCTLSLPFPFPNLHFPSAYISFSFATIARITLDIIMHICFLTWFLQITKVIPENCMTTTWVSTVLKHI